LAEEVSPYLEFVVEVCALVNRFRGQELSRHRLQRIFDGLEEQLTIAVDQQRRVSRVSTTAGETITVDSDEEASGIAPDRGDRRRRISGSDQPWVPRLEPRLLTEQEDRTSRRLVKLLRYSKGRGGRSVEIPFDSQGYVSLRWLQDGHIRRHEAGSLYRILADPSHHLGGLPRFAICGSLRGRNLRVKLQDPAPRPLHQNRRRKRRNVPAWASSDSELSPASGASFSEADEKFDALPVHLTVLGTATGKQVAN
jgi:hypothetical protein